MIRLILLFALVACAMSLSAQIQLSANGSVGIGGTNLLAKLNIQPQLAAPGANNLLIGNWWNQNEASISMGVHSDYAWIQSWNSKPLRINPLGNRIVVGLMYAQVGIGTVTPSYTLDVNGLIRANNVTPSDKRLKKDIQPLTNAFIKFKLLNPVTYNLDTGEKGISQTTLDTLKGHQPLKSFYKNVHYGFVAQDVQQIYPELVYEDEEGYLAIDYNSFIPMLVEITKNQQERITTLEEEIEMLRSGCCSNPDKTLKNGEVSYTNDISKGRTTTVLSQNIPNPFFESTRIEYFISTEIQRAAIYIYDMQGVQLKYYSLNQNGCGSITIHGNEFRAGMYMYSLIVDGQLIDTKRMILTD